MLRIAIGLTILGLAACAGADRPPGDAMGAAQEERLERADGPDRPEPLREARAWQNAIRGQ